MCFLTHFFISFTAVVFQVCIQNRYKLNKKYRKCKDILHNEPDNVEAKALAAQAKVRKVLWNNYKKRNISY